MSVARKHQATLTSDKSCRMCGWLIREGERATIYSMKDGDRIIRRYIHLEMSCNTIRRPTRTSSSLLIV